MSGFQDEKTGYPEFFVKIALALTGYVRPHAISYFYSNIFQNTQYSVCGIPIVDKKTFKGNTDHRDLKVNLALAGKAFTCGFEYYEYVHVLR